MLAVSYGSQYNLEQLTTLNTVERSQIKSNNHTNNNTNLSIQLNHVDFFYSFTVHSDVIPSFISPTNAQLICFQILKFTLQFTINAFFVYFNVNFNILKQIHFALFVLKKGWIIMLDFVSKSNNFPNAE
jgi:hypothetical protein